MKRLARENNLNLHGKIIKSKVGLDSKSIKLIQSSRNGNKYYPKFDFSVKEDSKVSIYYCTTQVTNSEGTPTYFTIPNELPSAGIVNVDEGKNQSFGKEKSCCFDVTKYEGMPLFNTTLNYYPCVIAIEPRTEVSHDDDGVSDYQNLITYCKFQINKSTSLLELKVVKQVLVAFDMGFQLQNIYGITDTMEDHKDADPDDIESGQQCVICISEEKNTVVMP